LTLRQRRAADVDPSARHVSWLAVLTFDVVVRLVLSTTVVVGGLFAVRWWAGRAGNRTRGAIRVVARAGIARSSTVAVVEVGEKRYLVGAGEHSVNLIAELDDAVDVGPSMLPGASPDPETTERQLTHTAVGGEHLSQRTAMTAEGSAFESNTRVGPRIGLVAHLRQMTTRVPREVRIHGHDS